MNAQAAAKTFLSATVIVPTYNRSALLPETLASILAQTRQPERILVIDDGSTEDTAAAVAPFGTRVELIRKPNGGKASALNAALLQTTSDTVWIMDDDDLAAPDALQRLSDALCARPDCGFSFGSYHTFSDTPGGTRQFHDIGFPRIPEGEIFLSLLERFFIHHPGLLVRRTAYNRVGPFDETMLLSEDFEMLLRLARHFPGVQAEGGPVFFQRIHAGPRGAAGMSVQAADREKAWKPYNQRILRRLHETCALEDFLPRPATLPLSLHDRLSALLQRSTAMGRRGVWDLAATDLETAVTLANEAGTDRLPPRQIRVLQALFDPWSEGLAEFATATRFLAALQKIRHPVLARDMRISMGWGLPYAIRSALLHRRYGEAVLLWRCFRRVVSATDVLTIAARKLGRKVFFFEKKK